MYQTFACGKSPNKSSEMRFTHVLVKMHEHVFVGRMSRRILVASCTSTFSIEECFTHVLVANAQAGSRRPENALHQA